MVGVVAAETDFMVRQGRIVEVDFGGQVVDARLVGQTILVFVGDVLAMIMIHDILLSDAHAEVVAVLGVVDRGVHEKLLRHDMVPTQGRHFVAPFPVHVNVVLVGDFAHGIVPVFHSKVDGVVARVETQIEAVFVGDFPIEFAIEVIEIITGFQLVDFL